VLARDDVRAAFARRDVALLKADWTNRNAEIARALEAHGRSGVPLYLLYDGSGGAPRILPQILTAEGVIAAVEALDAPAS
jgi:thiol:disulfide interchange protein DsbD